MIRKVDTNGVITTLGGTRSGGLDLPIGVAVDAFGNVFIADHYNQRVRKVDVNGVFTTVAGSESQGFSGDGGAAINARLSYPYGVAVDASGNLFIGDQENDRIRQVDGSGIITTLAGTGSQGYSGDGGPASKAAIGWPDGLAVDFSGNIIFADELNNRVLKITKQGPALLLGMITAANGGAYNVVITSPFGSVTSSVATATVVLPPSIVAQPGNAAVAVGGSATLSVGAAGTQLLSYSWYFNGTNLVQYGTNSNLSLTNLSIDEGGAYTVVVTNLYGSVTSLVATLLVACPPTISNNLTNQTVSSGSNVTLNIAALGVGPFTYQWQFNGTNLPNNIISTVAGNGTNGYSGDGGAATNAMLSFPNGVAVDSSGNLFIADLPNNRIRKVDAYGIITTVAGGGTNFGNGVAATNADLNAPRNVAVDASGNLFITDTMNGRLCKMDANGIISTVAAGLSFPNSVAVDGSGNLFIAALGSYRTLKRDVNGIITTVAGNGVSGYSGDGHAATNASLNPYGVAVDASGNLFIADANTNRIRKVDLSGIITTVAGNGTSGYSGDGGAATHAGLSFPNTVTVDTQGNMFIADEDHSRIRKVDINGIITTVAGNGTFSHSGDGGAATNASLYYPSGVAVDTSGNLFIADSDNNRIREVDFGGLPTLTINNFSTGTVGNYQVIITSPYGSVTGAVSTLTLSTTSPTLTWSNPAPITFGTPLSSVQLNAAASVPGSFVYSPTNGTVLSAGTSQLTVLFTPADTNDYTMATGNIVLNVGQAKPTLSWTNPMPIIFGTSLGSTQLNATANVPGSFVYSPTNGAVLSAGTNQLSVLFTPNDINDYTTASAVATLTVQPSNQNASILINAPVILSGNLILGFSLSNSSSPSFTLLQTPNLTGPWTTNTAALLTTNSQTGGFQFAIPTPNAVEFYQVRSP